MMIRLLHPLPHTPLRSVLEPLFQHASRVESAVAFVTRPGVRTFLKLVANPAVRQNSRFVASIRWPTDLDALGELAAKMPGRVYIHRGYFLPEESNHDRSLMHSKTVYIENGQGDVHILVGSHNWTGQALDGNNLEASVHIQCPQSDPFAAQVRTHIDRCVAESEVFDPSRLDDYKAIQVALHGWPDGPDEEASEFARETVVVIHAEEDQPGLANRLDKLRLYSPVWESADDKLFAKDQAVHLYLYPPGSLFTGRLPTQDPVLYTGLVEMLNRPNDPVGRRANCTIRDFDRPVLSDLTGAIPTESRRPVRQLVIGLKQHGPVRPAFYHRGSKAPRYTREVNPRQLTADEAGRRIANEGRSGMGRPEFPNAYTAASVDGSGQFVFAVPDDPVLCCVVSLPARELYPADVEEEIGSRRRQPTLFSDAEGSGQERRVTVRVEPCDTFRRYVYKVTYHMERLGEGRL
jgi:HKD family nuclease